MDALLFLKPILTGLIMPAALGPLLVVVLSVWAFSRSPKHLALRLPIALSGCAGLGLWLVSCPAVAVWLSLHLLPQVKAVQASDLKQQNVQAIVVLGGGSEAFTHEYDGPNLSTASMSRLLYGLHLAQSTKLPIAFSGGKGWGGQEKQAAEAEVADAVLARLHAPALRWQENQSRDTRENAQMTANMLQKEGITHIALVTHAWHMPRSVRNFENAGFKVLPAPMGYIQTYAQPVLQWMPQGGALQDSCAVLKEWLGWRLT
jgi:uncharacterized SAM-binding protein YcdF (DUF218 family)